MQIICGYASTTIAASTIEVLKKFFFLRLRRDESIKPSFLVVELSHLLKEDANGIIGDV